MVFLQDERHYSFIEIDEDINENHKLKLRLCEIQVATSFHATS